VGTLVERKTHFDVLCKMDSNGAEAALDSFTRKMGRLPVALLKSMTYDRGSEMACHPELARLLKKISGSAIRTLPGSAAATRTPTDCCVSSCPKELT
jgi:hypothetical protein